MLIPHTAEELTPGLLTEVVRNVHRNAAVTDVKIVEEYGFGDGAAHTSARARLELMYGAESPPDLPSRVMVKLSFDTHNEAHDHWSLQLHAIFENEVNFYNRIRPALALEAPLSLGGCFDPDTKRYVLIMEDVGTKGAHFSTVLEEIAIEDVQNILDTYARLHAQFWETPRFKGDLSWLETLQSGRIRTLVDGVVAGGVQSELARHKFRREVLERLGTTERGLFADMLSVNLHQSRLPQTVLHGDSHIANTYRLPDGTYGLNDWQVCMRGYMMHDVANLIITSLPTGQRRKNDRELLMFYRDKLQQHGVSTPPDMETLWLEYRRATMWPLYIGWLGCPVESYGWDTVTTTLHRIVNAYEDLETNELASMPI